MLNSFNNYIYDPFNHPKLFHFGRKIFRIKLGKHYKHLSSCTPFIKLSDTCNETEGKEIFWKGKLVGTTKPLSNLQGLIEKNVYIVATGPSLTKIDFNKLKDQKTFGVNGSIARFDEHKIPPNFYTVTDRDFFENRFEMIASIIKSGAVCLFSIVGISRICMKSPQLLKFGNIYLTEVINQWYDRPKLEDEQLENYLRDSEEFVVNTMDIDHSIGFSTNSAKGIFCGKTIPYRAIQHAHYMGAKNVFLLGLDLGYKGDLSRFYENEKDVRPSKIERDFKPYIEPSFKTLKDYMEINKNFKVYNLSQTSRLSEEIIPRISFKESLSL